MHAPREWPEAAAPSFRSVAVTLCCPGPNKRGIVYANKLLDKRALLDATDGVLWAFWKGQYSADLFVVDREAVMAAVAAKPGQVLDPRVEKVLQWWFDEATLQGLKTVRLSRAAPEVKGAKLLLGAAAGRKIQAVGQFALTDTYWKGRVRTVAMLWKQWDLLVADWQRSGSPDYVESA